MVAAEVANITEQEAELYDRQIRLLGIIMSVIADNSILMTGCGVWTPRRDSAPPACVCSG